MVGLKVGGWEFFIKMFLYYVHERAWYKVDFGLLKRKFLDEMFAFRNAMGVKQSAQADPKIKKILEELQRWLICL